jgi:hypothetical protein
VALFTRRPRPEDPDEDFDELPAPTPARPAPPSGPRPIELREWEIPAGYAVAGLIVLLAVLELTITHGKGAAKNPSPILPLIALVVGLAQAATIRFKNRLLTGILGVAGGLLIAYVRVPDSLGILHSIGFLAPFVYAFLVTQRHSRAQRALQGPRNRRQGGGGSRRGSQAPPEPGGPKASRRYTPPKAKEDRTRRR